jgi:hypothetical protein
MQHRSGASSPRSRLQIGSEVVMRSARPRSLEEYDRLAAYAEFMRDMADQRLTERQRATRRDRIWALLVFGMTVAICLIMRWFR